MIIIGGKPPTYLRHIDNGSGISFSVLDEEAVVQPLVNEVLRLEGLTQQWLLDHDPFAAAPRLT